MYMLMHTIFPWSNSWSNSWAACCCPVLPGPSIEESARKHPKADVFINYASFRRYVRQLPHSAGFQGRL
jgi:hypothetical protein